MSSDKKNIPDTTKSKWLLNPFVFYIISFGTVLLVNQLNWSKWYPSLSWPLLSFFLVTMLIMAFLGLLFQRRNYFSYKKIKPNITMIKWLLLSNFLLLFAEFAAARTIPLLSYLRGGNFVYTEFGLPFIHVIVVNLFSFLAVYIFHGLLSSPKGSSERRTLIRMLFWANLPAILMFNRGMILYILLSLTFLYLMYIPRIGKLVVGLFFGGIGVLYMFGLLGNIRTDTPDSKNLILNIGQATNQFKESWVPTEFFWGYLYIATPVGNLQHTINNLPPPQIDGESISKFVIFELTPDIISKRISKPLKLAPRDVLLVIPALNVSSVYAGAYANLGWPGMWLMFGFYLFFIFATLLFVPKNSPYFCVTVAIMCTVVFFNLFSNMFIFMGLIPQLLFPIILSLKYFITRLRDSSAKV